MNVKNKAIINKISKKLWRASVTRNIIAIVAIMMTTLLFSSMFTIVFSINTSYQEFLFRQVGGYAHGTFKNITEEQKQKLLMDNRIVASGERILVGVLSEGKFAKEPAEISYMDENAAKWSYNYPTVGKLPEKDNEIAMDLSALNLLGFRAQIGNKIYLTYTSDNKIQKGENETDEFMLVGFWESNDLLPTHFINVSKSYVDKLEEKHLKKKMKPFVVDLNIMLHSSFDIKGEMEKIARDSESFIDAGNNTAISIGVNWAYTSSQMRNQMDIGMLLSIILFISIVISIGYLIISNIFLISVSSDVRLYGLLKTTGFTSRQIRRIIINQAIYLCIVGIPIGMLGGYIFGGLLTPYILSQMNIDFIVSKISVSYMIFILSGIFSVFTVLFSILKSAKIAGEISPVEAVKYTDRIKYRHRGKKTKGAKIKNMVLENIFREKKKVFFVIVSISFSLLLFNILFTIVSGFDTDKYLAKKTCADFVVSSPDYFNYKGALGENITNKTIKMIRDNTQQTVFGSGYRSTASEDRVWVTEKQWESIHSRLSQEVKNDILRNSKKKGNLISSNILIEGLDAELLKKVNVIDGNLDKFFSDKSSIALVLRTDDYGKPILTEKLPSIGDKLVIDYVQEAYFIDSRTGYEADEKTPEEYKVYKELKSTSSEYTVQAYITIPYAMSFRFLESGYNAMLPVEILKKDSGTEVVPLFYLFDTPNVEAEVMAEKYLQELSTKFPNIAYESKFMLREKFNKLKEMFSLVGGLLCAIIGFIGGLNYFNSIMSSFLSRKREFAILQAIGMTERQLKKLFLQEGGFYISVSLFIAFSLSILLNKTINTALEKIFWFFKGQFTILPFIIVIPIFLVIGYMIPYLMFRAIRKLSIIERIKD